MSMNSRRNQMKQIKAGKVIAGIAGAIIFLIISQLAAQVLANLFAVIHIPLFLCNAIAGILYAVFAYFLLRLYAEKVLGIQMPELAIPQIKIRVKWLIIAFILPLAITGIYLLLPGKLQRGIIDLPETAAVICAGVFFIGMAAGSVEEMVFRGFIMNLLDKKFGRKAAVLIPSVLFGLVHIIGMDFSILSCLQVLVAGSLVGIMFSFITLEQHSVWNSAIVHGVWNIITSGGILFIGENMDEHSVFSYVLQTDSFAVTGGEFGIESSAIAISGYVIVTLIAYMGIRRNVRSEI